MGSSLEVYDLTTVYQTQRGPIKADDRVFEVGICNLIAFLAADKASFVVCALWAFGGGYTAQSVRRRLFRAIGYLKKESFMTETTSQNSTLDFGPLFARNAPPGRPLTTSRRGT